ncbi:hypothetical protein ACW69C_19515 [Streptomyces sp. MN3]
MKRSNAHLACAVSLVSLRVSASSWSAPDWSAADWSAADWSAFDWSAACRSARPVRPGSAATGRGRAWRWFRRGRLTPEAGTLWAALWAGAALTPEAGTLWAGAALTPEAGTLWAGATLTPEDGTLWAGATLTPEDGTLWVALWPRAALSAEAGRPAP